MRTSGGGGSGSATTVYGELGASFDGQGLVLTVGEKFYLPVSFACTINSVTVAGAPSGSIVFDIWKAAGAIPTVANTITAAAKPTLSSAQYSVDSTLTGWGTGKTISAGDVLVFNIDSCSTITKASIVLKVTQT